jgi:uncharacterized protein YjdB
MSHSPHGHPPSFGPPLPGLRDLRVQTAFISDGIVSMPMSSLAVWRRRRFPSLFAALAMVAVVAACDGSTDDDGDVANLSVNPTSPTLNIGQVQQMVATATTSGGRIIDAETEWSTSAPGVATVSGEGLVTGVGGGTATISATVGGLTEDVTVTVWFPVQSVALAPAAGNLQTIRQEGSTTIAPTILDTQGAAAPTRQLVWTSSNTDVATVNSTGVVSARGIDGETTITATTLDGVSGNIVITVSGEPVVASVTIAPAVSRFMAPSVTDQFTVTARAASGTVLTLTGRTVVWTSSTAGTATVADGVTGGLVTAVAPGTTNVRVTVDGIQSNQIAVTVYPELVSGVEEVLGTLDEGDSQFFVIVVPASTASMLITLNADEGAGSDADIYLYNGAGTLIAQSFNGATNESITRTAPAAGRYVLEVNSWEGADGPSIGANLNLTITPVPPPAP